MRLRARAISSPNTSMNFTLESTRVDSTPTLYAADATAITKPTIAATPSQFTLEQVYHVPLLSLCDFPPRLRAGAFLPSDRVYGAKHASSLDCIANGAPRNAARKALWHRSCLESCAIAFPPAFRIRCRSSWMLRTVCAPGQISRSVCGPSCDCSAGPAQCG